MAAYLGLSGWPGWGHDPAACLIVDGTLVAAVEEERFVRKRHAFGLTPVNAIAYCLRRADIRLEDIDAVGIGWNGIARYSARALEPPDADEIARSFLPDHLVTSGRRPPIRFLDHHECHAWSAIWSWPNCGEEAAVLVLDGQGDIASGASFHWKHGRLKRVEDHPVEVSLGYLFEAGCAYAGFGYHEAGKLMALAAMGEVDPLHPPLIWRDGQLVAPFNSVRLGADGRPFEAMEIVDRQWTPWLHRSFGAPECIRGVYDRGQLLHHRSPDKGRRQRSVAATLQASLEEIVLRRAQNIIEQTGERHLCYAGGVALNCVANRRLATVPWIDQLTIPPAANDAGTAIGAALMLAHETDRLRPLSKMPYWGPSSDSVAVTQECARLGLAVVRVDDPTRACAEIIARGGVVARMAGALEFGPRALGHRSLLAPVAPRQVADRLNTEIKGREIWRPFGAAMTMNAAGRFLEDGREMPHMLVALRVAAGSHADLAAIVHADGTTRPQTVGAADDQGFWEILQAVGRMTGVEAVVNTSFNAAGLPLVATLRHAIADAFATPVDVLIVDDVLVKRREGW